MTCHITVLGDSSSSGIGIGRVCYPAQLARILCERDVHVFNSAVPGFTSADASRFFHDTADSRPLDYVIVYLGNNEGAVGARKGSLQRRQGLGGRQFSRAKTPFHPVLTPPRFRFELRGAGSNNSRSVLRSFATTCGPSFGGRPDGERRRRRPPVSEPALSLPLGDQQDLFGDGMVAREGALSTSRAPSVRPPAGRRTGPLRRQRIRGSRRALALPSRRWGMSAGFIARAQQSSAREHCSLTTRRRSHLQALVRRIRRLR